MTNQVTINIGRTKLTGHQLGRTHNNRQWIAWTTTDNATYQAIGRSRVNAITKLESHILQDYTDVQFSYCDQ